MTTFAGYGDSLTATPDFTWINGATAPDVMHVGGYAHGGYRSYQVAQNTTPVPADVTVIMVGTNDVSNDMWRVPLEQTLNAIRDIVVKSNAARALIVAMPPRNDDFPAEAAQLNTDIRNFATAMGWFWVDPWTQFRTPEGRWRAGCSVDGIHPVRAVGRTAGEWLRHLIRATVDVTTPDA